MLDLEAVSRGVVEHLSGWPRLAQASWVLTYLAMEDEVDLASLAGRLPAVSFAVSRTPAHGPLTVHPAGGELESHPFGFRQPVAGAPQIDAERLDVVLVPGLAFDRRGVRLGSGQGYFDELISRLRPDALRVGVVPSLLVVERLPEASHDHRMSHLVTEDGIREVED